MGLIPSVVGGLLLGILITIGNFIFMRPLLRRFTKNMKEEINCLRRQVLEIRRSTEAMRLEITHIHRCLRDLEKQKNLEDK